MRRILAIVAAVAASGALWAQNRNLDVTQFVVLGEGLAAGVHDFGLRSEYQKSNFPALVARQIGTILPQPLMQGPGLAIIPGMAAPPAFLPNSRQTLVREGYPPSLFVFNLSVPGMTFAGAVSWRPAEPMVRSGDAQQTLVNVILGYPALILGKAKPLWTQLEYAERMNPTLALVCLGYQEAADAAAAGDPARMPDAAAIRSNLGTILPRLRKTAEAVVMNVPDPFDTAAFISFETLPRYVGAPPETLTTLYGLGPGDWITPAGLIEIGTQLLARKTSALPPGSVVNAGAARLVRARIQAANTEIASLAQQNGAVLYDAAALFRRVRSDGAVVRSRQLTADYMGGFYSLSGFYPGLAGHALIANGVIETINRTYGRSFPAVDVDAAALGDPAARRFQTFRRKVRTEDVQ